MNSSPFFSVVIPTYNRADSIAAVFRSLQDQTFSNFECLIIDDGSQDSDKLSTLVDSLNDTRFIYLRKENEGASRARNVGFDAARGAYIALLDSDDLFLPHKLERCASELAERNGDVLLYSRLIVNRGIDKVWVRPPRGPRVGERIDEYLMCTSGCIQTSTMVLPTELARRVRFDEALPSSQDNDFAIRVANAGAEVVFIEEPLVIFEDSTHHTRVSKGKNYQAQLSWIERMKGVHVSDRAYWAYRGWQCARLASYTNRALGVRLYAASAVRGVYPLRQALIIAAQVLIPRERYQAIANRVVSVFGRKTPSTPAAGATSGGGEGRRS